MNETSKEILENYQVRKTKAQKTRFIEFMETRYPELRVEEGGFPKGVVNLVTCSRNESEVLLTDPRVKAVTFVGTTEVGKHIS